MIFKVGIDDIKKGLRCHHIWLLFGWFEIKMRYKRSVIGPFWLTASLAFMVLVLGFLYAQLFQQSVPSYMSFIGCSLISWYFVSQCILDGCRTFIASESQIKQVDLPLTVYAMQTLWRNVIILLHNLIIAVVLIAIFRIYSVQLFLFIPLLAIVLLLMFFINIILGLICTRYRDIPQIVQSVMQIMMFITPVFWKKTFLEGYEWVTMANPMYHLLELMRSPLLGNPVPIFSLYVVIGMTFVSGIIALWLLSKYKRRLAFWV